jgi:aryl carrier-like protein
LIREVAVDAVSPRDRAAPTRLAAFVCFTEDVTAQDHANEDEIAPLSDRQRAIVAEVLAALSQALPQHMLPSAVIPVREMPLNLSRKIDRSRLRQMGSSLSLEELALFGPGQAEEKEAPTNPAEEQLRTLWADVLGLPAASIGRTDNFFRLGGDSIDAMRIVTLAQQAGWAISVSALFRAGSLAESAVDMQTTSGEADPLSAEPFSLLPRAAPVSTLRQEAAAQCDVHPEQVQDLYKATPLQEGLVALSQTQPGAYIHQNVFVLPPSLDLPRFQSAWDVAVNTTEILRTRLIYSADGTTLQVVLDEPLCWNYDGDLDAYLSRDQEQSIGYGQPLSRYAIIDNAQTRHFVWTAHHAVYDGWSVALILNRLTTAYESQTVDPSPAYAGFIAYLQDLKPEQQEAYWRAQLDGCAPPNFPPQGMRSAEEEQQHRVFTETLPFTQRKGSGSTASSLIRAAWALLVARYSGADEATFGSTLTGRNIPVAGIAGMIGPTIATVPVRDDRLRTDGTAEHPTALAWSRAGLQLPEPARHPAWLRRRGPGTPIGPGTLRPRFIRLPHL